MGACGSSNEKKNEKKIDKKNKKDATSQDQKSKKSSDRNSNKNTNNNNEINNINENNNLNSNNDHKLNEENKKNEDNFENDFKSNKQSNNNNLHNSFKNDNVIINEQNQIENDENQQKLRGINQNNENKQSYVLSEEKKSKKSIEDLVKEYIICPFCKKRTPQIKYVYFDSEANQLKIEFKCVCDKFKSSKEVELPMNKLISEDLPNNLCNNHNGSKIIEYCKTCKKFLCELCSIEHEGHDIKKEICQKNEEEIDELKNNLKEKQQLFETECEKQKNLIGKDIDDLIDKLKNEKEEYIQQIDDYKAENLKIFSCLNTLYKTPKKDILFQNNLKHLLLNTNDNKLNHENFETNFNKIKNELPHKKPELILNYNFNIIKNTTSNIPTFENTHKLQGHKDKIVVLLQLKNGYLVSGSYDHTIKVWDLNTYQEIATIKESGSVLSFLEFEPNYLLSSSSDNKIKLFCLESFPVDNFMFVFTGHALWVNSLVKLNNNYFASGSNDTHIRIWDYRNRKCMVILKGHSDCVLSLILLKDGHLCSGAADNTINIWDWKTGKIITTLKGHTKWVKCVLQLNNEDIISGSDDKLIKVWKKDENGEYKFSRDIVGHNHSVRTFCQLNDEIFCSGSFDKTIKFWNIKKGKCIQTLKGHQGNVICLIKLKDNSFASCSNDQTIIIWK